MAKSRKKPIRTKGKFSLRRYFQKLNEGDKVSVIVERAVSKSFPERLQGRTGMVLSKRGKSYMVEIKDQNKKKSFLVEPIHLKKIKA